MAFSEKQWEIVRAFFERGLSLGEIVARKEVEIKDRSSISKKAKNEGWIKGKNSTLVEHEVKIKQQLIECVEKNQQMNSTELKIHETLVSERIQDETLFRKINLIGIKKIAQKMQTEDLTVGELKTALDGVGQGQENIYPRRNSTAIQINNTNAQQQQTVSVDQYLQAREEFLASI